MTVANNKNILFYSLDDYIEKIQDRDRKGDVLTARIMSLALPFFDMKEIVSGVISFTVKLLPCAIKIVSVTVMLFTAKNAPIQELVDKIYHSFPGPVDLLMIAIRVIISTFGILLRPVLGILSPSLLNKNLLYISAKKPSYKLLSNFPIEKGFKCIVGMEDLKKQMQVVIDVFKNPKLARSYNLNIPSGLLLEGPPGCGKTHFTEKFIEEVEIQLKKPVYFCSISGGQHGSKWMHETENNIYKIFKEAEDAAKSNNSISIILIDEIDCLLPKQTSESTAHPAREATRGAFLKTLETASARGILVMAATNYIDRLDPSLIRPGRFDFKVNVPLPDRDARKFLFESFLKDHIASNVDLTEYCSRNNTEGWSISDIKAVCEAAKMRAFNLSLTTSSSDSKKILVTLEMLEQAYCAYCVNKPPRLSNEQALQTLFLLQHLARTTASNAAPTMN